MSDSSGESDTRPSDFETRPLRELRRSYLILIDTLRDVSRGDSLDLDAVGTVVDEFIDGGVPDPSSSTLLATVQSHDEIAYYHSANVCLLSIAIGQFAGFGRDHLRILGVSGLLHDVGRLVVDGGSTNSPGRLSNEDWTQVRQHPQDGALMILDASGSGREIAAIVALEHHARVDGEGYPDLGGTHPHLFSRIVAIADSYDAITSFRAYRPARTPNITLRVLLEGAGAAFDPDLLRLFIQMTGEYPPGSFVVISDGRLIIVTVFSAGIRQGLVVRSAAGELLDEPEPIELTGVEVLSQVMADEAGVDPGLVLEAMERGQSLGS